MRSFQDDLAQSRRHEDFWRRHYSLRFPNLRSIEPLETPLYQNHVVDRAAYLHDGTRYLVEEKNENYPPINISLETRSNMEQNRPGWMDKRAFCDFLAIGFVRYDAALWIAWKWLRRVWMRQREEWTKEARRNKGTSSFPRFAYNKTGAGSVPTQQKP